LQPVITVSPGATISPASGSAVDFSYGYANFTVTSESGAKKVYTINTPIKQFEGDNANIQYVGRINFANVKRPRFSAPGVYVKAKFSGTYLDMMVFDINGQNYVEVIIDNNAPVRMGLSGRNIFRVASGLSEGEHTVMIIKDTEASMGYLEFRGFRCDNLLPLPALPTRKIECFGNSITCGACMLNGAPCALVDNGTNWNGANCAYLSYGALTARALNAQWHISAVSGIGLIQSCCNMTYTMPDAYDRVYLNESTSAKWDFTQYVPDVVTICLGQNDGSSIVASKAFKDKYVAFINTLRGKYPNASVFCVTSPMADSSGSSTCLFKVMKTSLASIVDSVNKAGDSKVYWVTLPHDLRGGCTSNPHPNVAQHESIAAVLEAAIKSKMGW
jgi:hypothetical protein